MTDTLTTPAFTEDAAALAEISNGSSTTVATDPAPAPEPAPRPVTQRERIPTIDVVRGVALMGILFMNISSFSARGRCTSTR